jgi:hypothetical protein
VIQACTAIFVGIILMLSLAASSAAGGSEDAETARKRGDYGTAFRLYRSLADQGSARARYWTGVLYGNGQGVPQNYAEAAKWYRLAADQGDAYAQYNLASAYYSGQGVPQNYVSAHMWWSLSAAQDQCVGACKDASKLRDIIAGLMTTAQVAEAQKLAADWRPKTANASPEITPQSPSPNKAETAATSGTAFFVSNNGEALTNAHVVEGCHRISVKGSAARLLARDNQNDLAVGDRSASGSMGQLALFGAAGRGHRCLWLSSGRGAFLRRQCRHRKRHRSCRAWRR